MDNETSAMVAAWMEKAESDMTSARIILASNEARIPFDAICFHCQQAVEKFFKGYLTFLDSTFPQTHNIGQLIECGLERDQGLGSFLEADSLTTYGVSIRYPDDFYMPTRHEAHEAYTLALAVKKYVLEKIMELG